MSAANEAQRLDDAAKEHEKQLVIDLGADRLFKWIGVYLFLAFAVIAKFADIIENDITCFPENNSETFGNAQFLKSTAIYCWDIFLQQNFTNTSCAEFFPKLQNPSRLKDIYQNFPYYLVFQAFAFALPWSYWHFRFGARVLGHLQFMQLLLDSIYQKLKKIQGKVAYRELPYDEDGRMFDGYGSNHEEPTTSEETNDEEDPLEKLIVGKMKDRHFFSMLCCENFAHLPHLPYIFSVFKLTGSWRRPSEPEGNLYYLDQALLYLWCDKNNLRKCRIIKTYLLKHIFTVLLALAMLGCIIPEVVAMHGDAQVFPCQLADNNTCVFCSFRGKRGRYILLIIDLVLTFVMLLGSCGHWLRIKNSTEVVNSKFFEELKITTASYGLNMAYREIGNQNQD